HLIATRWMVKRAFPRDTLTAIDKAIKASEAMHRGEIRFAVEGALHIEPLLRGQAARERAIDVFSQLRIWDTEHNNGILIYLLLADRNVEIVADRGIDAEVGPGEWEKICRKMEAAFRRSDYEGGVVGGIREVTRHLAEHFPPISGDRNELPDKPVVL
ncbi:MAG TPA: TPM domain-containing protein, partial [Candidatus Deferrimicrobium sp.]|nr:TPM domain-containing protein [Candidatus Deferrimicrobium sp.]